MSKLRHNDLQVIFDFSYPAGADECYTPDQMSCNKFKRCVGGKLTSNTCPNGLVWSTMANKCEWPDKVNCGARPITVTATSKPSSGQRCRYMG